MLPMHSNLPLFIGLRYLRAKRRNQFISFVSGFSLVGMSLGVMALIIVLSVMNGFDRELKERILSVVPHGFLEGKAPLSEWQPLAARIDQHPEVVASAPYIEGFGLVGYESGVQGVQLQGILPDAERKVSVIEDHMIIGSTDNLQAGEYNIVLGRLLARYLGVTTGDKVVITLPDLNITPAGVFPRLKRFTLVGVFEVGAQVDQNLAMIHLADAQKLFRYGSREAAKVQGLHIRVQDIYRAGAVMGELGQTLNGDYSFKDWSQTQGSLFQAVKMEKTVIGVMLMIIVAVAAFNIVSSLVLMVADKRSDIAVLRTIGLSARQVMAVFIVQGSAVGVIGVVIGAVSGTLIALSIGDLMVWIENTLGLRLFDPSVYFITRLPSQFELMDLLVICSTAIVLSVIATLYPAYRAAQIQPAEALRYE